MHAYAAQRRGSPLLWAGIVIGVYAAASTVVQALPRLERPSVVAAGLTLDLIVVVPLGYYLLMVRRRGVPVVTLAPVVVLSVLAAGWILPPKHQMPLRILEALAVPLELGVIGWVAWRAARAFRRARRDEALDPLERLRRAAFEVTRNDRAAAVLAMEAAVFYYAMGSWWARPHAPAGAFACPHHRRSGHGRIVAALLLLLAFEAIPLHLLLWRWSAVAAWLATAGTLYGALWLIADYRATVLRPILVGEESLLVRSGFRCTLSVPRALIAGVGRKKPDFGRESLDATLLGSPTHWLTLSEPLPAEGPYGRRRRVRALGLRADLVEEFDRFLSGRSWEDRGLPTRRSPSASPDGQLQTTTPGKPSPTAVSQHERVP
jgi:hypothetical protein